MTATAPTGADAPMTAMLRDEAGREWTLSALRQDQSDHIEVRVTLESSDHATSYTQQLASTSISSSLRAAGERWSETRDVTDGSPLLLSAWSDVMTRAGVDVSSHFAAPAAPSAETGYGWCDGACATACGIATGAAGNLADLLICEAAVGWTGLGTAMCSAAFLAVSSMAGVGCTADCTQRFCPCQPSCGLACGQADGCGGQCPDYGDVCGSSRTGYQNVCNRWCPPTTDACGNQCQPPFTCDVNTGNCTCTSTCSWPMCGQTDECGNTCPVISDCSQCGTYDSCGLYCGDCPVDPNPCDANPCSDQCCETSGSWCCGG